MSQWFAANANGARVFAPGTVAIWLNHFSDTPQFFGCCDQTVRTSEFRGALFSVYYGEGEAGRGEIAATWLKLYGTSFVGVADTDEQPYGNVDKFDGVLEEAWRQGNSVVYRIPRPNDSLAHVVPGTAMNIRPVTGAYDLEPLQPLINALDHPPALASFRWLNQHEAEITARTGEGQVLFVQETCDPGWHAYEGPTEREIVCAPFGLITIDPAYAGPHTIRLVYSGDTEDRMARAAQVAGVLILIVWTLRARRRAIIKTHD
jgi:hypothetical protein